MSIDSGQKITAPVITIDGPSGAGKGTVASMLAQRLGWHFLDSGAIYRCLAYAARQKAVDLTDVSALTAIANDLAPRFILCGQKRKYLVWLADEDVTDIIREEIMGQTASQISKHADVRTALFDCQRQFAQEPGLVADGRDMGTVIFPDASLKIFLDATPEERAKRRFLQLQVAGQVANIDQITDELRIRDDRDRNRRVAPLQVAKDAIIVETTNLSIADVVAKLFAYVNMRDLVSAEKA